MKRRSRQQQGVCAARVRGQTARPATIRLRYDEGRQTGMDLSSFQQILAVARHENEYRAIVERWWL